MGPPRYRYALVNIDKMKIVAVEGKVLLGRCLRCGKCCGACEYLVNETLDGRDHHACRIYFDRPARCALYPQPQDQFKEGCGFRYEEQAE